MINRPLHYQHRGQSLIEVMLALSISLILLLSGYAALQTAEYQWAEAQQRVDQHDQQLTAVLLLQRAVEQAGLMPFGEVAAADYDVNLLGDTTGRIIFPGNSVIIYKPKDASKIKAWGLLKPGSGQWLKTSDVLVVYSLSIGQTLAQKANKRAKNITLKEPLSLQPGDVVVLTNPQHQLIDSVVAVFGRQVTLAQPLPMGLVANTRVNYLQSTAYYIGNTMRLNLGKAIPALYAQDLSGIRYELVPDIAAFNVMLQNNVLYLTLDQYSWRVGLTP